MPAKWIIVADSSCELRQYQPASPDTLFATVPLKIRVGEREFVDNAQLDTAAMMQAMHNYNGASSTACPSPEEWAEKFMLADNVIALTISSNLSGSYNSAMVARDMVLENHPEKKIYVMDSLSAGGELVLDIWKLDQWIGEGRTVEEIGEAAPGLALENQVLFSLACFDNLVKNGRMSRLVGFVAGRMNMRAVGRGSDDGILDVLHKTRGETRMLALMLEEMDKRGYDGLRPVVISHCNNETAARLLRNGIRAKWNDAPVHILPCGGLCSFYAEDHGIIMGY